VRTWHSTCVSKERRPKGLPNRSAVLLLAVLGAMMLGYGLLTDPSALRAAFEPGNPNTLGGQAIRLGFISLALAGAIALTTSKWLTEPSVPDDPDRLLQNRLRRASTAIKDARSVLADVETELLTRQRSLEALSSALVEAKEVAAADLERAETIRKEWSRALVKERRFNVAVNAGFALIGFLLAIAAGEVLSLLSGR